MTWYIGRRLPEVYVGSCAIFGVCVLNLVPAFFNFLFRPCDRPKVYEVVLALFTVLTTNGAYVNLALEKGDWKPEENVDADDSSDS